MAILRENEKFSMSKIGLVTDNFKVTESKR